MRAIVFFAVSLIILSIPSVAYSAPIAAAFLAKLTISSIATAIINTAIIAGGSYLVNKLFGLSDPAVPEQEGGRVNLKQEIPPISYVLGTVRKGSDFSFFADANGSAYEVLVWAAHEIDGYVQHYVFDKKATLNGSGVVTSPSNYNYKNREKVIINERLGASLETAYSTLITAFPGVYTGNHRGDGLASIMMWAKGASAENFNKIFPNGLPEHTAVGNGMKLYDPRTELTVFSSNIALMRFWHLTSEVGGRLTIDDMYLPDWINAFNVCDELVTNRDEQTEPRYHGGMFFYSNTDPSSVGATLDQAADMIPYQRADGKIGVFAGEFVEPTVTLTDKDIISIDYNANESLSTNVLAVRGEFIDTDADYVKAQSPSYGDPYIEGDDTQRTETLSNQAVQSSNHAVRLQKLLYQRKNNPKVTVTAHYDIANELFYSRFFRITSNPGLNNSIIEITDKPKISLKNLTITVSGILISSGFYNFDASTEEGAPGDVVKIGDSGGAPLPINFAVVAGTEVVGGGATSGFVIGSWDAQSDTLIYEMEYEKTDLSEPAQSVFSKEGDTEVKSQYLADGVEYRLRLRSWSVNSNSEWTDYLQITVVSDTVTTDPANGVSVTPSIGEAQFDWTSPNSNNYFGSRIYVNTVDDFSTATIAATEYGAPNSSDMVTVPLAANTYYGWIVAINASGLEATEVATGQFIVT